MHWYLIHTKPRQEKCARDHLEQQGYECYLPLLSAEKLCQGKLVTSKEALFPRYMFIRLGQGGADRGWGPIRSTRGVSRIVAFGAKPARIPEGLINLLRTREELFHNRPVPLFHFGERVRLTEGPFAGIEGVYQIKEGAQRVMVLIEMMSKPITVQVDPTSLRKVG